MTCCRCRIRSFLLLSPDLGPGWLTSCSGLFYGRDNSRPSLTLLGACTEYSARIFWRLPFTSTRRDVRPCARPMRCSKHGVLSTTSKDSVRWAHLVGRFRSSWLSPHSPTASALVLRSRVGGRRKGGRALADFAIFRSQSLPGAKIDSIESRLHELILGSLRLKNLHWQHVEISL